ncbi:MAG: hypothetical protein CMJ46_12085 [Planctomyces sp.]|nr:hypothetical protein [Planctomyces sp.]
MNPKTLAITVVVVVAGLILYSIATAPSTDDKLVLPPANSAADLPPKPEVKATGKQPKAVTEETSFDFGKQAQYATGKHVFKIYNKGEAPLELTQGESSCKCTIGNLSAKVVEPGGEVEVELEWTPEGISTVGSSDKFNQYAVIYTNDPETREIEFRVTGFVFSLFEIVPAQQWDVGSMTLSETKTVKGRISSLMEPFKINEITTTHESITAEARELTPEELKEFEVKNGFEVAVTVAPGFNYGEFGEFLELQTDYKGGTEVKVRVEGKIKGPFTFLNTSREKGVKWGANIWTLDMGTFSAAEGRTVDMKVIAKELDQLPEGEEFKILDAKSDLEFLKVNIRDMEQSEDKANFTMQFEYVAGSPPILKTLGKPVKVTIETNHPEAKMFEILVLFSAN